MSNLSRKLFLLVEDSEDDSVFFKRALRQAELHNPITKVETGLEAAMYLVGEGRFSDRAQHPFPSMMFLDLGLPSVDGFETLATMRESYPRSKLLIVVLTGRHDLPTARKAYALGADSFLIKPARPQDFLNLKSAFPSCF